MDPTDWIVTSLRMTSLPIDQKVRAEVYVQRWVGRGQRRSTVGRSIDAVPLDVATLNDAFLGRLAVELRGEHCDECGHVGLWLAGEATRLL